MTTTAHDTPWRTFNASALMAINPEAPVRLPYPYAVLIYSDITERKKAEAAACGKCKAVTEAGPGGMKDRRDIYCAVPNRQDCGCARCRFVPLPRGTVA